MLDNTPNTRIAKISMHNMHPPRQFAYGREHDGRHGPEVAEERGEQHTHSQNWTKTHMNYVWLCVDRSLS